MKPYKGKLYCSKCPPNKGHNRDKDYLKPHKNITRKDKRHRPK